MRRREAGDAALADELGRGFVYVEPLAKRLQHYEAQRERFPTLGQFYTRLLAAFERAPT